MALLFLSALREAPTQPPTLYPMMNEIVLSQTSLPPVGSVARC